MTVFEKIRHKLNKAAVAVQCALADRKAEGFVDTGVKILIGVVIGTLLFNFLYVLFAGNIYPTANNRIYRLFNYSGT